MNSEKIRGLKHCRLHIKNLCYAVSIISDEPFALGIPELTLPDKTTFGIQNNINSSNWLLLIKEIL